MKKNLLSVLVLVLVVVNIVISAIMMISIIGTNKKTAELITSVAMALYLELYNPGGTTEIDVPLVDTVSHEMNDVMIQLRPETVVNADGTTSSAKPVYIMFNLTLQMNSKHEDYATYGANITDRETVVLNEVERVISSYTKTECDNNFDEIKQEVLASIQHVFGSDFIFQILVTNKKFG